MLLRVTDSSQSKSWPRKVCKDPSKWKLHGHFPWFRTYFAQTNSSYPWTYVSTHSDVSCFDSWNYWFRTSNSKSQRSNCTHSLRFATRSALITLAVVSRSSRFLLSVQHSEAVLLQPLVPHVKWVCTPKLDDRKIPLKWWSIVFLLFFKIAIASQQVDFPAIFFRWPGNQKWPTSWSPVPWRCSCRDAGAKWLGGGDVGDGPVRWCYLWSRFAPPVSMCFVFLKVMGFIKGVKADLFLAFDERKLPTLALKNVMTMVSYGARQRCKTEILPLAIKNTLSIDGRKTVLLCHFGFSRCSLWFWKALVRCCRCRLHP